MAWGGYKKIWLGGHEKIKCVWGGVRRKIKCMGGVRENFFPVRPPLMISSGMSLSIVCGFRHRFGGGGVASCVVT